MKIALTIEALSPELTGIGRYTWELANRLPQQLESDGLCYYRNGRWVEDPAYFLEHDTPPRVRKTWLERRIPRWYTAFAEKQRCRSLLFHGPNFFLPPCTVRGVATIHDLSVLRFPETHPLERIKAYERHFKESLARADHLITVSESGRREVIDLLAWPGDKVTAVHNGVATSFAPRSDAALAPVLLAYGLTPGGYTLCVSTLEPRKKIANLIAACRDLPLPLRQRYPLVLVGGKGWLNEALHAAIAAAQVEGWCRPLGFVPESDLPSLYAGARLFVYPSIYEGFGLPVAEAMACGVPVVTSNRSCLPEVTQGAALLVEPDNHEALRGAIVRGLYDDDWRATAIIQGLTVAKAYSWERCVEETVAVYRIVGGG